MYLQQDTLSDVALTWGLLLCAVVNGLALVLMGSCRSSQSRRGKAEQKAASLLKQWLSPEQLTQYENNGHFEVRGSHTGKLYRIRCARQMNVEELNEQGVKLGTWCFGPEGCLPVRDIMLAQKIVLENDERTALAIANRGHRS